MYEILIPAYKPDTKLVDLVDQLRKQNLSITVVDDGGGETYAAIFEQCKQLGAQVAVHTINQGKGRAMKTGINDILMRPNASEIQGVITADADGQHTPEDIMKVIAAMEANPDTLIMGSRAFSGKVPFKSRAGNAITRCVYSIASGIRISDTQTGLRGLPASHLPQMLKIDGERYEYEMNMLMKLKEISLPVIEVPIETIYIDDNKGSHFNPLRDAWKIYKVIFTYMFASISSFIIDYALYLLFLGLLNNRLASNVAGGIAYIFARILSSLYNYKMNKHTVFHGQGGKHSIYKYYALVVVQMAIGAGLTALLSGVANASIVKLPVDILLFCASYFVQRDYVFSDKQK